MAYLFKDKYIMEESEELRLLRENNEMLKELLTIARQHTDPDYIKSENDNDFFYECSS